MCSSDLERARKALGVRTKLVSAERLHAATAGGLRQIYTNLARRIGWERRPIEVTGAVAGLAAVLALAAVILSRRLAFSLDG